MKGPMEGYDDDDKERKGEVKECEDMNTQDNSKHDQEKDNADDFSKVFHSFEI